MQEDPTSLSSAAIDQLGERLRKGLTTDDLRLLDQYRREFRPEYAVVVASIRAVLGVEVSGRPAKSTSAITDKLGRGSMRLSQMQDISGCRIVVPDIQAQELAVQQLGGLFPTSVLDRRAKPSNGYRAVHVVARPSKRPIEIQVRTALQHLWAELSEKAADTFGIEVKYGGGPKPIRDALDSTSSLVGRYENLEPKGDLLGSELSGIRQDIERSLLGFLDALREQR
jgi:putative GTP pyrophosphokinase